MARGGLRARLRDDRGFTLTEMLVGAVAGFLVVSAALAVLDTAVSTQSQAEDRVESVQRGRGTMNVVSRVIRSQTCLDDGAPAIVEATRTVLRLHTSIAGERLSPGYQPIADRRLVFDPTARTITLQTYDGSGAPPYVTFPGSPSSSLVVATNIRQDGTTPFFRYYGFQGNPPQPTLQLDPGTGALNQTQRQQIVRITVQYRVTNRDSAAAAAKWTTFGSSFWARSADPDNASNGSGCG